MATAPIHLEEWERDLVSRCLASIKVRCTRLVEKRPGTDEETVVLAAAFTRDQIATVAAKFGPMAEGRPL